MIHSVGPMVTPQGSCTAPLRSKQESVLATILNGNVWGGWTLLKNSRRLEDLAWKWQDLSLPICAMGMITVPVCRVLRHRMRPFLDTTQGEYVQGAAGAAGSAVYLCFFLTVMWLSFSPGTPHKLTVPGTCRPLEG